MIRRPPRSTRVRSSAASDVYKRQISSSKRTACAGSNKALLAFSRRASLAPALTLHRTCANEGLLTAQRPTDGASAPPLLLCAADDFRFLAASVVVKFRRATPVFFCKGGARSNPSNRGDPFLASLRAIMGEGGMDKSAPPAQLHAPPAQRGLFMFGKSFLTPGIHYVTLWSSLERF